MRERPKHPALVTVSVMLGTILYSLDWTIASVALPHMQGTFSATQDQIGWVITSYIVASAIMIPTTGWLSGRLGRKRLFMGAMFGFMVASALCGAAETLTQQVTFRVLQGMSGAFLVPLSQAIVLDTYPPEEHGKAMAFWGMGAVLGPVIGPTVGGFLIEYFTWRWIFYINIPFGILALLGTFFFVDETPVHRDQRFDWFGFIVLAAGVGALQMMLDRGERRDWFESTEIVVAAGVAVLGFYLFISHCLTSRDSLLNLRLFANRNYAIGLVFIFFYGLFTLPPMVLMPPFMLELGEYPILSIGLLQSPRGVGLLAAMIIGGRIANRVDPRLLTALGIFCITVASWAMSRWNLNVDSWPIVWTGFLHGVGAGIILVPIQAITFTTLGAAHHNEAASVFNLVRSIGSSVGVSIALLVLTRGTITNRSILGENLHPYNELARYASMPEAWNLETVGGLIAVEQELMAQATMIAYVNVFHVLAIASAVTLPLLLFVGNLKLQTRAVERKHGEQRENPSPSASDGR
jgi:DHA2 family multidrug resistance protein